MIRLNIRLLAIAFLVLVASNGFAQNQHIAYPNVAVMTPKAAALSTYSDIPVSYYTGLPEINIPLYEIDVDGFKIPITLSYHSSGIRVSQEATWVGLGWSLNAGGVISRQVNFVDDFLEQYWDRSHPWVEKGFYDCPQFTTNTDSLYKLGGVPVPYGVWAGVGYYLTADPEPDVFSYSIPGYSGKFIFGTDKKAVLFERNHNIKVDVIRANNNPSTSLKLTDGYGNQYFFNDKETSLNYLAKNGLYMNVISSSAKYDDNTNNYWTWDYIEAFDDGDYYSGMEPAPVTPYEMTSAWCLTKIVTNKGRVVNFTYENEDEQLATQESSEIYNSKKYGRNQFFYRSKLVNKGKRLKKISWDVGCVEFTPSSREDIKGTAKKLDCLVVKNSNGDVLKDYQFIYSYFNDDYTGTYPQVFKRLKLTGVYEPSFTPSQGYSFTYYEGAFPAKNSKDTDYWGMQNGRTYGKEYCVGLNINGKVYPGVTKEADFSHAVIGTLKQINYPTGGYARFTYESHQYGGGIGVDVNNDKGSDRTNTGAPTSGTHFHMAVYNDYVIGMHPDLPETDTLRFKINTASTLLSVSYNLENHQCDFEDPEYAYCSEPLLTLYKVSDSGKRTEMYNKECPYLYEKNIDGSPWHVGDGCEDAGHIGRSLAIGKYELVARRPPKDVSAEWNVSFDHLINLLDENYEVLTPKIVQNPADKGGAGLRIAKIETDATTRTFTYPQGRLLKYPLYHYFGKRIGYSSTDQAAFIQASESKSPLTTFGRGDLVGYDWVEENVLGEGNPTRTRYYYMNEPETEQFDDTFPDSPFYINYTNGLLTRKETYNGPTLLKEDTRSYSSTKSNIIYAYRDRSEHRYTNYTFTYLYEVEWPLVTSATEIVHESGGDIVSTLSYTYNSHDLLSTASQTVQGDVVVTRTKYPFDLSDAVSTAMTSANLVAMPVEITTMVNGSVYGGKRLTYTQSESGGLFLPSILYRLNSSTGLSGSQYSCAFSQEMKFTKFNEHGNPLEIYHNGEVTSYIWSYYGFYPIAEVKNATYAQLTSTLGQTNLSNFCNKWPTDSEVATFLAPLRSASVTNRFLVLSYTHKPLFGVTSITSPSGMKSYFEYDGHGRLQKTRDTNQMLLQQFHYNYHY